ncbi:MAG: peptide chain release factor family protein [Sedimentisphaeraceae bacterium JB056]
MASRRIQFPVTELKAQALYERMDNCGLQEADLDEQFVRSSGPGGQNVNKTSTCVMLKHNPTGLEVKCAKRRSQGLNRYYARKSLCELLENAELGNKSPAAQKADKIRKQKQRRKRRASKK